MDTAQSKFNEVDLTFSTDTLPKGRSGFMGVTKRGPVNRPDILINSWPAFVALYGGLVDGNDFPLQCKRALDGGAALRVCNIRHYTTITDPTTLTATTAEITPTNVFTLAGPLLAGHVITYTIGATTVTQNFSVSSDITLKALITQIKSTFINARNTVYLTPTSFRSSVLNGPTVTVATSGTGTPPAVVKTALTGAVYQGVNLFQVTPKYPGADYNSLVVTVGPASNGRTDSFNLTVDLVGDGVSAEVYKDIFIPGPITAQASNYLAEAIMGSKLANFVYNDLTSITTTPIVPVANISLFGNATDGGTVTDTDYIGDSTSRSGFQAFNTVDDIMQLAYGGESNAVHIAGAAYAENRKDIMYWAHLSNNFRTETDLVTARLATGIDSTYTAFFAGGVRVLNPFNNLEVGISEIGDIMGLAAQSDNTYGPWYSFAGPQRGKLKNILGVVNNFGSNGNTAGLNQLANAQINTVISRGSTQTNAQGGGGGGKNMLWGSFTAARSTSTVSFVNVRRLLIHLKKLIRPLVEQYLEEPNDIITWKKIYMEAKPVLDDLAAKRAFYGSENIGWTWQGDQFANTLEDLVINNANDVGLGKYKVRLFVKDVVSLQEIQVDIVLTNSDVSFEEALTLITT